MIDFIITHGMRICKTAEFFFEKFLKKLDISVILLYNLLKGIEKVFNRYRKGIYKFAMTPEFTTLPAYKQMYRDLKEKIENEQYGVGMLLPSEKELCKAYAMSRTTVRKAIALLSEDGFVRVKQGYGTEIIHSKTSQCLNRITSVSKSIAAMGYTVGVQNMRIERSRANFQIAKGLHLEIGAPLILITRIQTSNGEPITIAKNYISESYVPDILYEQDNIVSLYQYLKDRYGIQATRLQDRISACNASPEEAEILNVEPKTALIVVNRVCSMQDVPYELDCVKIIASKYEYKNDVE